MNWVHFLAGALCASMLWGAAAFIHWCTEHPRKKAREGLQRLPESGLGPISLRVRQPDGTTKHVRMPDEDEEEPEPGDSIRWDYVITLADWGPDFTGEDGTLPRWRWTVWAAPQTKGDLPLWVGNSPTKLLVERDAWNWLATHRGAEPSGTNVDFRVVEA